jgi:signal transduction histidine kinase
MKIKAGHDIGTIAAHATSSGIVTEFQTPLGVIISTGEVLENYFDRLTPERRRVAFEDILSAARQMNQTIDSLIAVGKEKNRKSKRSSRREPRPEGLVSGEAPYLSGSTISDKLASLRPKRSLHIHELRCVSKT